MSTGTKRRSKGDGMIRKRKDGSWEGRVPISVDPETGKTKYKYVYAKSMKEVRDKMRLVSENKPEINTPNGKYIKVNEPGKNEILFGDWLDTWLTEYKLNSLTPSTYESYYVIIHHHLKPALGDIPITAITAEQIQKLLNEKMEKGGRVDNRGDYLSPSTVIKIKVVINASLKQAMKNKLIPFNPTEAVTPPKQVRKEIRILTVDEQKKFMSALNGHRLEALFKLALATGMRKGELMALTWDCVDFENRSIKVTKSASRIRNPHTRVTSIETGNTKTASGVRQVPILPGVLPVLKEHRRRQEMEKRIAGSAYNRTGLVFCSNIGTYIEPRRVNTTLGKLVNKAGIEHINFHALRHTFATRALETGIPAKVVQEILGHSDVALTLNRYTHVLKSTAQEQMNKMNELFASMDFMPEKNRERNEPER
jgi:integrase